MRGGVRLFFSYISSGFIYELKQSTTNTSEMSESRATEGLLEDFQRSGLEDSTDRDVADKIDPSCDQDLYTLEEENEGRSERFGNHELDHEESNSLFLPGK